LACQAGVVSCRRCDPLLSARSSPGIFTVGTTASTIEALEIATLFLSYVIGLARRAVEEHFGERYRPIITYNMCLPMEQFESGPGRDLFLRALFLAERLAPPDQGMPLEQLRQRLRRIASEHPTVPPETERATFVQPESVAAMMAFVQNRLAEEGLYGVVDVGAGTTDVAFFRLFEHEQRALSFYHADTKIVGADDIDRALLLALSGGSPIHDLTHIDALQAVRVAKQSLLPGRPFRCRLNGHERTLFPDHVLSATNPVVDGIFAAYQNTWRAAYRIEPRESRWRFGLFCIGGGSRFFLVRQRLQTTPPWERLACPQLLELPKPEDLRTIHCPSTQTLEPDLLAVAYGLSFHPAQFPKFWLPGEMTPPEPPPRRPPPDPDEWYPK
jgi:hypothetical protein